jgi:hypothetical protein
VSIRKDIVIQDACILFDLIDLGLMTPFFNLEITVMTTPQVIVEVVDDDQLNITQGYIDNGRLKVDGNGELTEIQRILNNNSGLSFADSSVLELAIRVNGAVLSSDLKLRNATVRSGLTVRGILWVVEELHTSKLLATAEALQKLSLYKKINDRAPRVEIRILIEKISKLEGI